MLIDHRHHHPRHRPHAYRRRGLVLDDRQHRLAVHRSRSGYRRRGIDPGVALLVGLALLLLLGWLLIYLSR